MRLPAPFLRAAVIWAAVSLALVTSLGTGPKLQLNGWFLAIWASCLLDLAALAGLSQVILRERVSVIQALAWGSGKMFALSLVGIALWRSKGVPVLPILLGAGTMMMVPLLGAAWWFKEGSDDGC